MTTALVINAGSSSIKWKIIDGSSSTEVRGGIVERLGQSSDGGLDHKDAMRSIVAGLEDENLSVIGHRVVHGGTRFTEATLVTEEVEEQIGELSALAPLHNPVNLAGIRATRSAFPSISHVAVFDTAFHQSLAPAASTYALPARLAERHGIRRYGFHGISYQHVSARTAELLGRPLSELRLILFHLGNGASACAMSAGRSVETSMGMTPLEGLVMGSRTGDLDPGVILQLGRAGLSWDELDTILTRESGLLGLAGTGDMREIQSAAAAGDAEAALALDVYSPSAPLSRGVPRPTRGRRRDRLYRRSWGELSCDTRRDARRPRGSRHPDRQGAKPGDREPGAGGLPCRLACRGTRRSHRRGTRDRAAILGSRRALNRPGK